MRLIIKASLFLSLTLLLVLSCGGDDPPNGNNDTSPPTVLTTIPVDNSINFSVNSNIVITFSEKINQATATSTNIILNPPVNGLITVNDSVITYKPSTDLAYNTDYIVTIANITDLAGNKLASNYSLSFRTIKDYANTIPEIISSSPFDGQQDVPVDSRIEVTFSEYLNPNTINVTTFYIDGVSGTYSFTQINPAYLYKVGFNPSSDLQYDTTYDLIITTDIEDPYGNSLAQADTIISFTTEKLKPNAFVVSPADSSIGTGLVDFVFGATHPIGIDKYEFYVDDVLADEYIGNVGNHTFTFDFSALEIGTIHQFYAMAYDTAGNSDTTDVINMYAHWEILAIDGNDGFNPLVVPNDVRKILGRSTDSTLELRIEYGYNWQHPYVDTAVDLGMFFDTDLNGLTGRRDAAADSLNGIGADFRIILGLHGGDTCLSEWNPNSLKWELVYDTTGLIYHNLPQDTNIMEISLLWDDMNVAQALYLVAVNVYFPDQNDPNFFINDFIPDRGDGFITIRRASRLVGTPVTSPLKSGVSNSALSVPFINISNPFN